MQETIQIGQVQPSMLSNVESIVKNCKAWLDAKSDTFSALCGEDFTHKEVLLAHAACMLLIVICGLSSYLVWVGVKFSNAKEEELLINDASQIGSKKFDFSIE